MSWIPHLDLSMVSRYRFLHTMVWAVIGSALIVAIAAGLARATLNLNAALTDKPDIALYLLLPDEEISTSYLLRENGDERDYFAETKDGPKLIRLKKGAEKWYVDFEEQMHK